MLSVLQYVVDDSIVCVYEEDIDAHGAHNPERIAVKNYHVADKVGAAS